MSIPTEVGFARFRHWATQLELLMALILESTESSAQFWDLPDKVVIVGILHYILIYLFPHFFPVPLPAHPCKVTSST